MAMLEGGGPDAEGASDGVSDGEGATDGVSDGEGATDGVSDAEGASDSASDTDVVVDGASDADVVVDEGSEEAGGPPEAGTQDADVGDASSADASDAWSADATIDGALDDGGSDADALPSPEVVATQALDVYTIAVDGPDVYWSSVEGILSAPVTGMPDGGPGDVLVSAYDESPTLALRNGQVYYTLYAQGVVGSVSEDGGSTRVISDHQSNPLGVLATDKSLFWETVSGSASGGTLATTSIGGGSGSTTTLAGVDVIFCCTAAVEIQGDRLYFLGRQPLNVSSIVSAPVAGVPDGGLGDVVLAGIAPPSFFVDPSGVYALEPDSTYTTSALVKVPLGAMPDGGTPLVLIPNLETQGFGSDGSFLYWNDDSTGRIVRAPMAGLAAGAPPEVVAVTGSTGVEFFAFDADHVYWADPRTDTIARARK